MTLLAIIIKIAYLKIKILRRGIDVILLHMISKPPTWFEKRNNNNSVYVILSSIMLLKVLYIIQHSGHAYITMSIILPITYISQTLMTDILATNNPILIKLLLLDLSYLDKSNGSIFIKFESLNAKIFPILHFYYKLLHQLISFSEGDICSARLLKINKFHLFNYIK